MAAVHEAPVVRSLVDRFEGMHALNELVACARRLQQTLGGTLQDDRGVPLTVHRIERLRQEVREFERPQSQASPSRTSGPSRRS